MLTVFLLRLEDWMVQWKAFLGRGKVVFIKNFKSNIDKMFSVIKMPTVIQGEGVVVITLIIITITCCNLCSAVNIIAKVTTKDKR